MTPALTALRDELANDHAMEPNLGATFRGSFKVGFDAAIQALTTAVGEFERGPLHRALESQGFTSTASFVAGEYGARWQHSQMSARVAATEQRYLELRDGHEHVVHKLGAELAAAEARVKELEAEVNKAFVMGDHNGK